MRAYLQIALLILLCAPFGGCRDAQKPKPAPPGVVFWTPDEEPLYQRLQKKLQELASLPAAQADADQLRERAKLRRRLAVFHASPAPLHEAARADLTAALEAAKGSAIVPVLLETARLCIDVGRMDEYRQNVSRASRFAQGDFHVRVELARRDSFEDGKWERAEAQLVKLSKEAEARTSADVWDALGHACGQVGRTRAAHAAYRKSIAIDGESPASRRAFLQSDEGENLLSEEEIVSLPADQITPHQAYDVNNRAVSLNKQKRFDESVELLEALTRKLPTFPAARLNLGIAYRGLERYDDAIRECRTAIELAPGFDSAYMAIGIALQKAGRSEEAVRAYFEGAEVFPSSGDFPYALASLLRDLDRYSEAELSFREAIRRMPTDPRPRNDLALMLANRSRFEEAIALLEDAIRLAPNDPRFPRNLASVRERAGK